MNTIEATVRAIELAGGAPKVAAHFSIDRRAVYQWRDAGRVPAERVLELEGLCRAAVTRYQLRPDVYGQAGA